jgi:hypothetical protein
MGSPRTLNLDVELVLAPAPSEQTVAAWITAARAFISNIGESVRGELAGQGPLVDAMYEMAGLLGKSGFRHTLHDNSLTLSFRTARVSSNELAVVESRMEGALKQMGLAP